MKSLALLCITGLLAFTPMGDGAKSTGEVSGVRGLELKADADAAAFEAFTTQKYYPMYSKLLPGAKLVLLKGERGKRKGQYASVWRFDSIDTRNFYFPEEGKGMSEMGQKMIGAHEAMLDSMQAKFDSFLVPPDTTQGPTYTDWVVLQ